MQKYGKLLFFIVVIGMAVLFGCSKNQEPEGKIRDLECSVLDEDEIPQPLAEVIEENKGKEMKLSYEKDGILYIARGFGEQNTGGYSIAMQYCYLAEDGIHVQFELIGPSAGKRLPEEKTYPYIVIQTDAQGTEIVFE